MNDLAMPPGEAEEAAPSEAEDLVPRTAREHGDVMAYLADGADAIEPIARRRLGRPQ